MDRKEFLQRACGMGLCSCAVASIFAPTTARADEPDAAPAPKPQDDWRLPFAQERYAQILGLIAAKTDEATFNAIVEGVGRYCAGTVDFLPQHAGDLEGFLATIREKWKATASYDAESGRLDLSFPPAAACVCPLVKMGTTPASMCMCSVGWLKHGLGLVFARPVEVEMKGTILRGDPVCSFAIRVAAA